MTFTPADPAYQVQRLMDEIADLKTQVGVLFRALNRTGQRATVTSGAGAMVNVQFTGTGNIKAVPWLFIGSIPGTGTGGTVVDLGDTMLFIPVSAYL